MRVIIAGSRSINSYSTLLTAIELSGFKIHTVLSGNANGVDKLGERYAKTNCKILQKFPAEWRVHGKGAGFIRNKEMAQNADALIAVWDGLSAGTKNMIDIATTMGLKVHVHQTTT